MQNEGGKALGVRLSPSYRAAHNTRLHALDTSHEANRFNVSLLGVSHLSTQFFLLFTFPFLRNGHI